MGATDVVTSQTMRNRTLSVCIIPVLIAVAIWPFVHASANGRIGYKSGPNTQNSTPNPAPNVSVPIFFEENHGQFDATIRFVARTREGSAAFYDDSIGFFRDGQRLGSVRFAGHTATVHPVGEAQTGGTTSYFLGPTSNWKTGIRSFERIRYHQVYPGIDMVAYTRNGRVAYDLIANTGDAVDRIRLEFPEAVTVGVEANGDLRVQTATTTIRHENLLCYQPTVSGTSIVPSHFRVQDRRTVTFATGATDPSLPLVIDPEIAFSTYLGGSKQDYLAGVAVDRDGAIYVSGTTSSSDFPGTASGTGAIAGQSDIFVAKLSSDGAHLLYGVYFGGENTETGVGIGVGPDGSAYVTGRTESLSFPVTDGAFDPDNGRFTVCSGTDCIDSFVTRIAPDGASLVYSTYLGGEHDDYANAIAVDANGCALIAGRTESFGFPRVASFNPDKQLGSQGFVCKMNPMGTGVVYSSYIGGNGGDNAYALAVDQAGNAYVSGTTTSKDFQVLNPFQAENAGGGHDTGDLDAFALKVAPDGSLVYATYLGGTGLDYARAIAAGPNGTAVVAGYTTSTDFPLVRPSRASLAGMTDAFVTCFSTDGSSVEFSSFVGGSQNEEARTVAVGSKGQIAVSGLTRSADFPLVDEFQSTCGGCASPAFLSDVFLTVIDPTTSNVELSTFLGGRSEDIGVGSLYVDDDDLVLAGYTFSPNFPTTAGALTEVCPCPIGDTLSAFILKVRGDQIQPPTPPTVTSVVGLKRPFRVRIDGAGFQDGVRVFIGADTAAWTPAVVLGDGAIDLGGGKSLKLRFPKRQTVELRIVNPDGGEATASFTR